MKNQDFVEHCKLQKIINDTKQEEFSRLIKLQRLLGECYKPKNFYFWKKCPNCSKKLNSEDIGYGYIIYQCINCNYKYAEYGTDKRG